jgi:putative addiction module killer protein
MNIWSIEYWHEDENDDSTIETFFDSLSVEQYKSVAKELKLLEMCGNLLRLPHSRALGNGLFELRERNYGFRIYYTFLKNKIIVLLNAGDKSSQEKDVRIAYKRILKLKM